MMAPGGEQLISTEEFRGIFGYDASEMDDLPPMSKEDEASAVIQFNSLIKARKN